MNLKKNRKVFTSKFVGSGPSSYIYKKNEFTGPRSHKGLFLLLTKYVIQHC